MAVKSFRHLDSLSNGQESRASVPAEEMEPSQRPAVRIQGKLLRRQAWVGVWGEKLCGSVLYLQGDPDAPSPDNPKFRYYLHWLVANIPGVDVQRGDVIVDYMGPVSHPLNWVPLFSRARGRLLTPVQGATLTCKHPA